MTEVVEKKKGMSKGCLIGLVVAGVLVVMVIDGERVSSRINVICEVAPNKARLNGQWGVNPISILRRVKSEVN